MLPLDLFRSHNFTGANLLALYLYTGLAGMLFSFPSNLIQIQRYSATQAGGVLLLFIFLVFLLSRWSVGLVENYGANLALIVSPAITA